MADKQAVNLSTEEKQVLRTERAINEMLATDGWKVFAAILSRKLHEKRNEYESPIEVTSHGQAPVALDGISQVLRAEAAKGAIMGIRLALELPQGMLADAKNLRIQKGLSTAGEDDS